MPASTSTIRKNILANYIGTGTVVLAPMIALPWYFNALGSQQFGLIGFIIMLQALLGLLDAGMSQALVREISVRFMSKPDDQCKTAELLFTFERCYWMFSLLSALLLGLFSSIVSRYWLNLGDLPVSLGQLAVLGGAVLFAVQFPGSIYRSMLIGGDLQVSLNIVLFTTSILRHLGAVLILFVWPSLLAYLIWHCSVGLLDTLWRRFYAWRCLDIKDHKLRWQLSILKNTWVLVAGMSAATWLGALTVQMDKVVLSRMVPIDQFGYYVIAASVAGGVLQMIYPLVQAVLPTAIQLRLNPDALRALSMRLLKSIALIVVIVGVGFFLLGQWVLNLWLGNEQTVAVVFPLLATLLVGTALNAFYNVGYMNWIAHERIKRVLQVNAISLFLSVLLIPVFISWQGTIGAAFGWLTINFIGLIMSLEWLKQESYD